MGMSSRSSFLALLALVTVSLSTIKGSSKFDNDLIQDGDKVKQEKVLELLDQYVMHVDRGADVDLEASRENRDLGHETDGQDRGPSSIVMHNSNDLKQEEQKRKLTRNIKPNKRERETGDKLRNLQTINRVRRNLRGVEKKDHKRLVKPNNRLHSKHGIKAKRSLKEGNRFLEEVTFSSNRQSLQNRTEKWADVIELESKPVHRPRRSLGEHRKQVADEFIVTEVRQRRNVGAGVSEEEIDRDLMSGSWTHTVQLDDSVTVSWKVLNGDDIEFLVEAATRGYVGLGFSPGGGMLGADIILSWVDDNTGQIYVVDSHGPDTNGAPVADPEQDCTLVGGRQNESHTVVRFRRALDTCDSNHDYVLGGDTVRVIWATQDADPMLDGGELVGMTWHGKENRGIRSLHLLTPPVKKGVLRAPQTQQWDVTLRNFTVPDTMDTLYWCKIFKVPPLQRKHHMIGYEPVLQPGNENYVHHMLLYECVAPHQYEPLESMFERYVEHPGESCYSNSMPVEWDHCMTAIVAWAVGSQGEFLPDHVGLPLADDDKAKYFMLEIHYDNPGFRKLKDSSGIRIHYTENLRQYDGAILVNGITITPLHIVPPYQPEYRTAGYCSSHCTHRMFPQTGIKLVSVVLHSHLAGKKLRLRHIRDGRELPRVAEDDNYDFNYQQARVLPKEVDVLPGDELVTECVYQTPNRTEPTFGGYSTKQEMCLAFVLYYPRTQLAACYSMTPVKYFFETFGVRQFYDVDMDTVEKMFLKLPLPDKQPSKRVLRSTTTMTTTSTATRTVPADAVDEEEYTVEETVGAADSSGGLFGKLVISEPDEFRNRSFTSHLVELPWTEKLLTQRVEESLYAGKHMVFCRKHDDQLAIPLTVTTFPNFTKLTEDDTKNKSHCEGKIRHSLRTGNAAASSVNDISYIMFLRFTIQAVIFAIRF